MAEYISPGEEHRQRVRASLVVICVLLAFLAIELVIIMVLLAAINKNIISIGY